MCQFSLLFLEIVALHDIGVEFPGFFDDILLLEIYLQTQDQNVLILLGRIILCLILNHCASARSCCDELLKKSFLHLISTELYTEWAFTSINLVLCIYPRLIQKNHDKACQITLKIIRSFSFITKGIKRTALLTHFFVGMQYHFQLEELNKIEEQVFRYFPNEDEATTEERTYIACAYMFIDEAYRLMHETTQTKYVDKALALNVTDDSCAGYFIKTVLFHIQNGTPLEKLKLTDDERKIIKSMLNFEVSEKTVQEKSVINIWRCRYLKLCG